jgi:hypothetical protein
MSTPRRLARNRPRDFAVLVAAPGDGHSAPRADEGVSEPASPEAALASPRAQRWDNRTTPERSAQIQWLDLDAVADVTIVAGGRRAPRNPPAWTADCSGEQLIEVRFRQPTPVSHLRVTCSEFEQSRTQEMTIWASLHRGEQHREVLRQQFNFSPDGATQEVEEYALQLEAVSAIQLRIVPSIDGRLAVARVKELRLASTPSGVTPPGERSEGHQ